MLITVLAVRRLVCLCREAPLMNVNITVLLKEMSLAIKFGFHSGTPKHLCYGLRERGLYKKVYCGYWRHFAINQQNNESRCL